MNKYNVMRRTTKLPGMDPTEFGSKSQSVYIVMSKYVKRLRPITGQFLA